MPANVEAAVQRAIAKSPADRFARASQFADALSNPGFRLPITAETQATVAMVHRKPRGRLWAGGVALLAVGLLAGWLLRSAPRTRTAPAAATSAVFFLPLDSLAAVPGYPVVSPDGTALVYPAGDAGSNRLYLRALTDPVPTPIPRTEGANTAFFSADGQWVGFLADQSLKKVRLADGSDGMIAPYVEAMAGATWGEDDTILFAALPEGSLFRVSAKGGTPTPLVIAGQPRDSGFYFPHYLPGGRAILFNTQSTGGLIGVLDLKTGERKTFGRGLRPSFIEPGRVVYATPEGRLAWQEFDAGRLELIGSPNILAEELGVGPGPSLLFGVARRHPSDHSRRGHHSRPGDLRPGRWLADPVPQRGILGAEVLAGRNPDCVRGPLSGRSLDLRSRAPSRGGDGRWMAPATTIPPGVRTAASSRSRWIAPLGRMCWFATSTGPVPRDSWWSGKGCSGPPTGPAPDTWCSPTSRWTRTGTSGR